MQKGEDVDQDVMWQPCDIKGILLRANAITAFARKLRQMTLLDWVIRLCNRESAGLPLAVSNAACAAAAQRLPQDGLRRSQRAAATVSTVRGIAEPIPRETTQPTPDGARRLLVEGQQEDLGGLCRIARLELMPAFLGRRRGRDAGVALGVRWPLSMRNCTATCGWHRSPPC
eukprot:scaffold215_cov423-Prasinococcus_capsulatus_cf.AAC.9